MRNIQKCLLAKDEVLLKAIADQEPADSQEAADLLMLLADDDE